MKTPNLVLGASLAVAAALLPIDDAHAQPYALGIDAPRQLPPASQKDSSTEVYYLKAPMYFGAERAPTEGARLRLPAAEQGAGVFVDLGSPLVNEAIREQLRMRGISTVMSRDTASYYMIGAAAYVIDSKPHPPKVLALGADFVGSTSVSGGVGDARRKGGDALVSLAATAKTRATDPASFAVSVLETLLDQTGVSDAIARERAADGKLQAEDFAAFDCYDKATRSAAERCSQRDLITYYLHKRRLQAVEVFVRFGTTPTAAVPKRDQRQARIIARRIDPRAYTGVDLEQLLALALAELTSGMGALAIPDAPDAPVATDPAAPPRAAVDENGPAQ